MKIKYLLDDLFKPSGVLVDWQIHRWASRGGIVPYDPALVNPCSIDVRWSGLYKVPRVDPVRKTWWVQYEADEFWLIPGNFILASTLETFNFHGLGAQLMLKSTPAREGLNHALAGLVDIGFGNPEAPPRPTLTLKIWSAIQPLRLVRGQRIAQLLLFRPAWQPDQDYTQTGRYTRQVAPQEAIIK